MKNKFLIRVPHLLLALLFGFNAAAQTTLYVAPNGTDANPGTLAAPTTLPRAIATIATGGTIFVRGGTYNYATGVTIALGNNGSKRLEAYAGEVPVLNFSGQATADTNRGLTVNGNNWYVKGLIVERAGDNGIFVGGSNNTFELCTTRFNKDSGLQLSRYASTAPRSSWPANNLILNCTSYDNQDPTNENADGFACKLTSGDGNVFRGCIAHHNIDDGWDFYAKDETGPIGIVTVENCVAYSNGALSSGTTSGSGDKNGFKLGGSGIPVDHIIRRSVAFNNGKHGITDNNNLGSIKVTNNTSFNNAETNFQFRAGGRHVFTNNLSFQGVSSDKFTGTLVGTSNVFWVNRASSNGGGLVVSAADFVSLTAPTVGRNADGSPNLGSFLALAAGSDLINAGVAAAGITFSGPAPDLGARESGSTTITPPPASNFTLTTTVSPAAGGSVTRSPNAASYAAGTVVTLTATPAAGYT
ncbi:MAG: right-handed parallel beta-helix repeat-containing protein, partial [Hymenobacter sp.]|nr:right-handed parallel beta-helix repeat-containing protein [Hymenobacter sp.]